MLLPQCEIPFGSLADAWSGNSPPLKTAPVFGGIAGIMSTEPSEQDDLGHLPAMSSKSRENGEMQDMYRRMLASTWAAQAGELPADECIEDIFAGGSGWGNRREQNREPSSRTHPDRDIDGDDSAGSLSDDMPTQRSSSNTRKKVSSGSTQSGHRSVSKKRRHRTAPVIAAHDQGGDDNADSGSSSQQSTLGMGITAHKDRRTGKPRHEVDEFSVREDLRSWRLPMAD